MKKIIKKIKEKIEKNTLVYASTILIILIILNEILKFLQKLKK